MELKTLTDRVLLGEYPLNATVETFVDKEMVITLAKASDIHLALVKERTSGVYQLVTSKKPFNVNTESWEILYNA